MAKTHALTLLGTGLIGMFYTMTLHQGRQVPVVLLRSGDDRRAVVADEVSTNQEVVVKHVGPQVSRLAGIIGATILGNGEIVLILNPVQLIVRAPEPPRLSHTTTAVPQQDEGAANDGEAGVTLAAAPLVMVVDDSLTVRRVTQRLLERSGYEVMLAKGCGDPLIADLLKRFEIQANLKL